MIQFGKLKSNDTFLARGGKIWTKCKPFESTIRNGQANAFLRDAPDIEQLSTDEMAWFDDIAFVEPLSTRVIGLTQQP